LDDERAARARDGTAMGRTRSSVAFVLAFAFVHALCFGAREVEVGRTRRRHRRAPLALERWRRRRRRRWIEWLDWRRWLLGTRRRCFGL